MVSPHGKGDGSATTVEHRVDAHVATRDSRATLVVFEHGRARVVELPGDRSVVVGRGFPSDVLVADPSLSRRHARFDWRDGALTLEDLGSKNGVFVAGERVESRLLGNGDVAQLGRVTVSVYFHGAGAALLSGTSTGAPPSMGSVYLFDDWRLSVGQRLLTLRGAPRPIEPKAFDLLHHLIVHRDRVVEKPRLRAAIWGDTKTSDGVLSQCVFVARTALGDSGKRQHYIKTSASVGYRFVAAVRAAGTAESDGVY